MNKSANRISMIVRLALPAFDRSNEQASRHLGGQFLYSSFLRNHEALADLLTLSARQHLQKFKLSIADCMFLCQSVFDTMQLYNEARYVEALIACDTYKREHDDCGRVDDDEIDYVLR